MVNILLNTLFKKEQARFPKCDKEKIADFYLHLQSHGFTGLPGRNKCSQDVPSQHPEFLRTLQYAKDYNLHHYHIGIAVYDQSNPFGDWTSEYVLHYMLVDANTVRIAEMNAHPPFKLPSIDYLDVISAKQA